MENEEETQRVQLKVRRNVSSLSHCLINLLDHISQIKEGEYHVYYLKSDN